MSEDKTVKIMLSARSIVRAAVVSASTASQGWDSRERAELMITIIAMLTSFVAGDSPDRDAALKEILERIATVPPVSAEMLGLQRAKSS